MSSRLSPCWDELVPDLLSSPTTLRMYLKQEVLGAGGFSKCFKMMDLVNYQTYAVKVLPLGLEPQHMIWQEINILSKLNHKHVVGFFQSFQDENYMYIFLELCSRKTLHHILELRITLTDPEIRYYTLQLISGLKYLHKKGILHRDIKLANLFIDYNMHLKLGDFGLATKMEPEETRNKKICGTPSYIAPEVWDRKGHGPESDVWAVGIVIYRLRFGVLPFRAKDVRELSKMIRGLQYIVPLTNSGRLIAGILTKDPHDRLTLNEIRHHKFFTKGFTPDKLTLISCFQDPEFNQYSPVRCRFSHVAKQLSRLMRSEKNFHRCESSQFPISCGSNIRHSH